MTGLKDLTVVLTGVSSGIGQPAAELLNEQGARIIGLDIKAPTAAVAQYIYCDIGDEASISAAAQVIEGPINALINVAGVNGIRVNSVSPGVVDMNGADIQIDGGLMAGLIGG